MSEETTFLSQMLKILSKENRMDIADSKFK